MINIIKQEIAFDESLKQRLEFICEFSHTTPTFINGFIHKVDKTNLSYVEPHKIIIKGITFLAFNYSNEVYIKNFSQKIKFEDQAREGFSLPEQKERLEIFCKFKGYEIVDYYTDAGISAKTGNLRPEFERLKEDIKNKKINTMVALKLDRITRSIFDWEKLMTF